MRAAGMLALSLVSAGIAPADLLVSGGMFGVHRHHRRVPWQSDGTGEWF